MAEILPLVSSAICSSLSISRWEVARPWAGPNNHSPSGGASRRHRRCESSLATPRACIPRTGPRRAAFPGPGHAWPCQHQHHIGVLACAARRFQRSLPGNPGASQACRIGAKSATDGHCCATGAPCCAEQGQVGIRATAQQESAQTVEDGQILPIRDEHVPEDERPHHWANFRMGDDPLRKHMNRLLDPR
jgi:hypothetical protein